jgi:hypothetical protein
MKTYLIITTLVSLFSGSLFAESFICENKTYNIHIDFKASNFKFSSKKEGQINQAYWQEQNVLNTVSFHEKNSALLTKTMLDDKKKSVTYPLDCAYSLQAANPSILAHK